MNIVSLGKAFITGLAISVTSFSSCAQTKPSFRVLAIAEANGGIHQPFVDTARLWLDRLAKTRNFSIDYVSNTDQFNDEYLSRYQLFIQLNYPPYHWTDEAKASFTRYITEGKGGWIGFHHATLLGEFDGFALWPWFSEFMGGIRYKNYISTFVGADVLNEAPDHPVMRGVPSAFRIPKEEFYIYDRSPRPNVRVLATVTESSYTPPSAIVMGDHPVIWTNEKMKARNVYIFMGHGPWHFQNEAFTKVFSNAIFWASSK